MTLRNFQRRLAEARAAADRGETVTIKGNNGTYLFLRAESIPENPFADLKHLFGVVSLPRTADPREKIRRRLRQNSSR